MVTARQDTITAGYKQTEIGVIPEDWAMRNLADVSIISRLAGAEYTSLWEEAPDGKIIALRGFNIGKGRIIERDFVRISNELSLRLKRSRLRKGDVVYPCVGSIGNAAVITEDDKYHIQQNIARITPNAKTIDSRYLANYLMSSLGEREVVRFNASSSQPSVLVGSLRQYRILLPPTKEEQEAIATVLSDTDALIEKLEELIDKKKNMKQGAMHELLTANRRLPGFSGEWKIKRLGELLKIRHGRSQKEVEQENGEIPIVATSGIIGRASRPIYDKPSVLIGRKGTIDKPQYFDTPFWAIDTIFYSEIYESCDAKFIFYRFNLINWQSYNEASGLPSLNSKTIEGIKICVPGVRSEQTAIATVLSDMDAEIEALEQKLVKYRRLKIGMMQQLLTGKIRVYDSNH